MRILQLTINGFRGFSSLTIEPQGHAVIMGTPGSGRSDAIEALTRVLDAEALGRRTVDELDIFGKNLADGAAIEAVIGLLGDTLEQQFIDHLELWNVETNSLIEPNAVNHPQALWVLRLCYRATWNDVEERIEERIFYPKTSDVPSAKFDLIRRSDLARLGFTRLRLGTGRILDLSGRSHFRQAVDAADGSDFGKALAQYVDDVGEAANQFTDGKQVANALNDLKATLSVPLNLPTGPASDLITFEPEGGSATGLLRSLQPLIDIGDGSGAIPLTRRGSTIMTLVRAAETMALAQTAGAIIAIEDLGDAIDPAGAVHLAASLRQRSSQVWISTRSAAVAEIFDSEEVFRLSRDDNNARVIHRGVRPSSKVERIAAKHWSKNVLPALSYRTVVILEGSDDLASLHALTLRRWEFGKEALPAARGISLISAAATGSGGSSGLPKLARAARQMGLWTIAVLDYDKANSDAILADSLKEADAVVRLPKGFAIERALVRGLDIEILRAIGAELSSILVGGAQFDFTNATDGDVTAKVEDILKMAGGLHTVLIDLLPEGVFPPTALAILDAISISVGQKKAGHIQL